MCSPSSDLVESDTSTSAPLTSALLGAACVVPSRAIASLLVGLQLCLLPAGLALGQAAERTRPASPTRQTAQLTGQVQDQTGAIIPGATIELQRTDNTLLATAVSDGSGRFRLAQPPAGEYKLAVTLPGFQPLTQVLRVRQTPLAAITLTMSLASVSTIVNVNAAENVDIIAPDTNASATTVTSDDLKKLPVFDGDIVATLSAFLDAGASGEGGATLIVDGVEKSAVGVAPSAIDQVIINQDPYSARFTTPGRGQVEILTKATADRFHGAFNFTFRDSALDATNAFAKIKPPEQRRIFEGYLTGPIKPLHNTSFLFSLNRQESDSYAQVNAVSIPAVISAHNISAPSRTTNLTMKVSHRFSDRHSAYIMYELSDSTRTNQSVGGLVQESAGFVVHNFDQDIVYHDDLVLSPTKLNQFSFLFEHNEDAINSNQHAPSVVVAGVATFGGGQNDTYQTEYNPNISDIFSWTRKTHQFKFGIQIPNAGRRVLEDRTNRLGTYIFPNLAAFQTSSPSVFSIQQGQSRFITHFVQPQAFFQDQLQVTPKLTVTAGLRYFWQNALPARWTQSSQGSHSPISSTRSTPWSSALVAESISDGWALT